MYAQAPALAVGGKAGSRQAARAAVLIVNTAGVSHPTSAQPPSSPTRLPGPRWQREAWQPQAPCSWPTGTGCGATAACTHRHGPLAGLRAGAGRKRAGKADTGCHPGIRLIAAL